RKPGKRDTKAVGQHDQERHIDTEGANQPRVLRRRAEVGAKARFLNHKPRPETRDDGRKNNPAAVIGKEHEAEILAARQLLRNLIGQAGDAVIIAEQPLNVQRQAEGQQQAVEVIEMIEAGEKHPLQHNPEGTDDQRREDQRPPVADPEILQQHPGDKGAHHVKCAMREIDDVEKTENNGEPERQHRIKRTVDESKQELSHQNLWRNSQKFKHSQALINYRLSCSAAPRTRRGAVLAFTYFRKLHSSRIGRKASSPLIVAIYL